MRHRGENRRSRRAAVLASSGSCEGSDVSAEAGEKLAHLQVRSGLAVGAGLSVILAGEEQCGGVKQLFKAELSQKKLVPPRIGALSELGKDPEVGLADRDGPLRLRAVLHEHEPSEPGARRRLAERFLPIGNKYVVSDTNRLFGTVVEIIAKGRSSLRLEFDSRYENALSKDQHVPLLRRPEIAGKLEAKVLENLGVGHPVVMKNLPHDRTEPIHLLAAGDCRTVSVIGTLGA